MLANKNIIYGLFFLALSCFSSCAREKNISIAEPEVKQNKMFIQMPRNPHVFENVAPLVYDALWNHFARVGFKVVDNERDAYMLSVVIQKVEPEYRFISPDLLTYAFKLEIQILCKLFDENKKLCAQKTFYFSTMVSKPKKSVLLSAFLNFEYKRLLERCVAQIDYYFRPFFINQDSDE
jgi:hypothetical protein